MPQTDVQGVDFPAREAEVEKAVQAMERLDRKQAPASPGRRGEGGTQAGKGKAAPPAAKADPPEDADTDDDDADPPESEPAPDPSTRRRGKPAPGAPERDADPDDDEDSGDPDDDSDADDDEAEGDDADPDDDADDEDEDEPADDDAGPDDDDDDDELPAARRLTREEADKLQRRLDREAAQRRTERRANKEASAELAATRAQLDRELTHARRLVADGERAAEELATLKRRLAAHDPDVLDELGVDATDLTLAYAQKGTPEGRARAAERKAAIEAQAQQRAAQEQQQAAATAQHETAGFAQAALSAEGAKRFPVAARLAKAAPGELYRLGCLAARAFEGAGRAYNLADLLGEVNAYMAGLAGDGATGYKKGAHAKPAPKPAKGQPLARRRAEPPPEPARRKARAGGLSRRATDAALPKKRSYADMSDEGRIAAAARKLERMTSPSRLHALTLVHLRFAYLTLGPRTHGRCYRNLAQRHSQDSLREW